MDCRSGPGAAGFLPTAVAPASHVILPTGLSHDDGQLSLTTTAAVGSTPGSTVDWTSSAVRSAAADAISLAAASTASSVGVPAAAPAVAITAAAISDGITAAALVQGSVGISVGPLSAPADGQASAAPRRPPTPRTPRERLSFLLRCAFRLRTRRDVSILSFMGIVAVTWKLDCLSAINNGGDRKLLRALLFELFSEPVLALQFMEETFGVGDRGMHLGGRLAAYKHTSGQPASFPSKELRAATNPDNLIGEWMSRNLCAMDELALSAGGAHERGLSVEEISALGARLRSPEVVREAHKVGCVVHFDGDESNNTLGPSKLLFNWNFSLEDDADLTALLHVLRPVLLKCPPHSLTRSLRAPVATTGAAAASVGIDPAGAGGGSRPPAIVGVRGADPTGGHLATMTGSVKRKAMGADAGRSNLPGASSTAKQRRVAPVKSARCTTPAVATCACSPERLAGGGQSWLVAEVRRTGNAAVLGMAVGLQLPWSLDGVEGGRVAIKYLLSEVAVARGGRSKRQYSLRVMQGENSVTIPMNGVSVVTQATTVSGNYKSRDFAAEVQGLCNKLFPSAGPPVSSSAADPPSALASEGLDAPAVARLPSTPLAALAVDSPSSPSSPVAAGPYGFNIIDAPAAAVLSVNVTIHSPVALNTEVHSASRLPGRLVLFFPVSDDSSSPMGVC